MTYKLLIGQIKDTAVNKCLIPPKPKAIKPDDNTKQETIDRL